MSGERVVAPPIDGSDRTPEGQAALPPLGADLRGARLAGMDLAGCCLRGARLEGALLVGASLRGTDLTGASLRGANLSGSSLRRADLSWADLREASLMDADLTQATAIGVDCRDAVLQSAILAGASLRAADMRWSRLEGAKLGGADLDGARFEGARLAMANLTGARLSPATDLGFAFLRDARFDRTALARGHVQAGIGEELTNLADARDTYHQLADVFARAGRMADSRWARRQALRMATAMHRPDRAARYFALSQGSVGGRPALGTAAHEPRAPTRLPARRWHRVAFTGVHSARWVAGHAVDGATGYGTSALRVAFALASTWLLFGVVFRCSGQIVHLAGEPVGWSGTLTYSAAALTPLDPYPLAATSGLVRAAAACEGVLGIVLMGTLGFVAASRWRHA